MAPVQVEITFSAIIILFFVLVLAMLAFSFAVCLCFWLYQEHVARRGNQGNTPAPDFSRLPAPYPRRSTTSELTAAILSTNPGNNVANLPPTPTNIRRQPSNTQPVPMPEAGRHGHGTTRRRRPVTPEMGEREHDL